MNVRHNDTTEKSLHHGSLGRTRCQFQYPDIIGERGFQQAVIHNIVAATQGGGAYRGIGIDQTRTNDFDFMPAEKKLVKIVILLES